VPAPQQGSPSLTDDPLGPDNSDESLAAIARRFEEKYVGDGKNYLQC
jgi:hypothetical protein